MLIKQINYNIILPSNVKVFLSLEFVTIKSSSWSFFTYPVSNNYLICYNLTAYSAAISKILPFFIIFSFKNLLNLNILVSKKNFKGRSVIYYALNAIYKLITLVSFGYPRLLQFVGFRFRQRWVISMQAIRLRLGYNRKVWVKCPDDFCIFIKKITPKKRNHILFSFDKAFINEVVGFLLKARAGSLYKGRGINIREKPMQLKEGKKTLW